MPFSTLLLRALIVALLTGLAAATATAQATDGDQDGIPDDLELNGYNADLQPCTPPTDDQGRPCYVTDPRVWSSDGDPYSDYTEATGINMDADVPVPFNHPLVAAYPVIELYLEAYTFTPIEDITDSSGGALTQGEEYTTTTEYTHSMTGTIKSEIGFQGPFPTGNVSAEVSETVSETNSWSSTSSVSSTFNWETATTVNTAEAARLKLIARAYNRGGATGLNIQPQLNVYIGGELVDTFTPTSDAAPFALELGPGERTPAKDLFVDADGAGTLTLTLPQLRAVQRGAPITIEVTDLKAEIQRFNSDTGTWACGTADSCDWTTFRNQIEARTTRLLIDFGYSGDPDVEITDLPVALRGNPFDFRVFTGSPFYAQQNNDLGSFGLTLRDALGFVGFDVEGSSDNATIEGRAYPEAWLISTDTDPLGVDRIDAQWTDAGRPQTPDGAALLLDVPLPPDATLALASPDPADPGPVIRNHRLLESMRGLVVTAIPKGSIPIAEGEARLVFTGGHERVVPLEQIEGTRHFATPDSLPLPIAASSYIVLRDILGNERTLGPGLTPSVPLASSCTGIPISYYREPRFDHTAPGTRDGVVTVFIDDDLDRPATAFCIDDGAIIDFWYPQTNDMGTADVHGIAVLDLERRVAVGEGALLYSENAGQSWTRVPLAPEDVTTFRAVAFREGTDTGVAVGDGGVFMRTEDGGRTWARATVSGTGNYVDVDYAGGDTWYAVGEARVRRSTDDGRSWTPAAVYVFDDDGNEIARPDAANLTAVSFISETVGVIGDHLMADEQGRVYETHDGGETWKERAVFTRLNDIVFDGGDAWYNIGRNVIQRIGISTREHDDVVFSAPSGQTLYAASFATPEIGYVVAEGGVVYRTDDGGETWTSPFGGYPTPTHPGANFMRDIDMLDANIGAVVGTDGVIGATDSGGGVPTTTAPTSIEDEPAGELPQQIALDQNYPNPFNPTTTITYQIAQSERVRLEVFDLLGRRVAVLVDGLQPAGRHRVRFDATHLASGMYLYRIQAAGQSTTRRMLLIR